MWLHHPSSQWGKQRMVLWDFEGQFSSEYECHVGEAFLLLRHSPSSVTADKEAQQTVLPACLLSHPQWSGCYHHTAWFMSQWSVLIQWDWTDVYWVTTVLQWLDIYTNHRKWLCTLWKYLASNHAVTWLTQSEAVTHTPTASLEIKVQCMWECTPCACSCKCENHKILSKPQPDYWTHPEI